MDQFKYSLAAIRGVQADKCYYQATVPFRVLASMLKLDDHMDVNQRSQRLVDKTRAKKVASYLSRNADGFYVIPPLVGFIEGDFEFIEVPLDGFMGVGKIEVSITSKFILFDGQHRAFGIREAMAIAPELSTQSVPIMFFHNMPLELRKQAFHDINFTQKTPAAALCIAYNGRSEFDSSVVDIFSQSSIRSIIEYEKNTVSGTSDKVYSLKTLKDFAALFTSNELNEQSKSDLINYTDHLFDIINIPSQIHLIELREGMKGQGAKYYRDNFILPHAVTLKALALLGKDLLANQPNDWKSKLEFLADKSLFYRTSDHWLGRCVNNQDKLMSNQQAVRLTYYKLKELCGIELNEAELNEHAQGYFKAKQQAA